MGASCIYLPVKSLENSKRFYSRVGFGFDTQFKKNNAARMMIGERISVMLIEEQSFKAFTKKEIADSSNSAEVVIAISVASKDKVDKMVLDAFDAGGKSLNEKIDDGKRYAWGFQDLDGHLWEIAYSHPDEK